MATNRKQTNILLCGSARVGKSTLINAICQHQLTKTTASLSSATKRVARYSYQCGSGDNVHETVIWDTPGIESWNEVDVRSYVAVLIEQTHPLCAIFCASPHSFALLKQVTWLVSECHSRSIFCALVCTNMWAGQNAQRIVDEFCHVLSQAHPNTIPTREDGVVYYGKIALATMVNSEEYVDDDFGVRKPPSGVEELVFGIGKCLERDLMFAWFRTVSQNASFWSKMSSKLNTILNIPGDALNSLCTGALNVIDLWPDLYGFAPEETASSSATERDLFHDAEIIELPKRISGKRMVFTFHSDDIETVHKLGQILVDLGASKFQTTRVDQEDRACFELAAKFDDSGRLEALQNFWQLASSHPVQCTIVP